MLSMECTCTQKRHTAPIKTIEVSENAILKVADILGEYKKIYVVCDKNGYKVAGEKVVELLENGVPYDIPDFRANFPKALAPLRNVCYNKNVPQVHNTAANGERIIPKGKVIKHEISVSSLPGRQIESRYHQL